MNKFFVTALALVALPATAFAVPMVGDVVGSDQAAVTAALTEKGCAKIENFKPEKGLMEVYCFTADGSKLEVYFDPASGKIEEVHEDD